MGWVFVSLIHLNEFDGGPAWPGQNTMFLDLNTGKQRHPVWRQTYNSNSLKKVLLVTDWAWSYASKIKPSMSKPTSYIIGVFSPRKHILDEVLALLQC